jgi:serine/threonine protein kinase/tetratricopeptide (TPR) repeat protein
MGQVWLARDTGLDRLVALKLMHAGVEAQQLQRKRFLQEARTLATLNHSGIVTVFEVGTSPDGDFIAMEFIDGGSLRERSKHVGTRELLAAVTEVAIALGEAHRVGVLHRDIKPDNIMLSQKRSAKLVDFGIARFENRSAVVSGYGDTIREQAASASDREAATQGQSSGLTGTHEILATPAYAPPEVLCNGKVSDKSDVYSLGVTIYELFAKRLPYEGPLHEMMSNIVDPRVRPVKLRRRASVPKELSKLVDRMIAQSPSDRPSIAEVVEALQSLQEKPVPQPGTRVRPALAAVALVPVLGAALWSLWSAQATTVVTETETVPVVVEQPSKSFEGPVIAIAPFALWAPEQSKQRTASLSLPHLLGQHLYGAEDFRVLSVEALYRHQSELAPGDPHWQRAAREQGATHLLSASVREVEGSVRVQGKVIDLDEEDEASAFELELPSDALAPLLSALSKIVIDTLQVAPQPARSLSQGDLASLEAYEVALEHLFAGKWSGAAGHLERLVVDYPDSFDVWYQLVVARSAAAMPPGRTVQAARRALELADGQDRRVLLRSILAQLSGDMPRGISLLESLPEHSRKDAVVMYHYADALYHDGRHEEGVKHFAELLRVAPRFGGAAWHPYQQALVARDEAQARSYLAVIYPRGSRSQERQLMFALGHYQDVLHSKGRMDQIQGHLALGQLEEANQIVEELPGKGASALVMALASAVAEGPTERSHELFETYWRKLEAGDDDAINEYTLLQLGEVLLAGGMNEAAERLLQHWPLHGAGVASEPRDLLRIHAAATTGRSEWTRVAYRSTRLDQKAKAVRAELAGKHSEAVALWQASLRQPHHYYDYLDRIALRRNLKALHQNEEVASVCSQLEKPAVFRPAMWPARCGDGDVASGVVTAHKLATVR